MGYRMITKLLGREGWHVNQKRIHRLWKQAGLQVPQKQHKKRRLGTSENGCIRLKATRPGHVWSIDFLFDTTEDGRQMKFMPVMDEYTRECFMIDVSRGITSRRVIEVFDGLFALHGTPANLRSDNGPEFVAKALREILQQQMSKRVTLNQGLHGKMGMSKVLTTPFETNCSTGSSLRQCLRLGYSQNSSAAATTNTDLTAV